MKKLNIKIPLSQDKKSLLVILVLFFLFFATPQMLRLQVFDNSTIGTTPYYHIRMAEMIQNGESYDTLSLGGRPYTYPPLFHLILSSFFDFKYFINPFFGVMGLLLCYLIAKEFGYNNKEAIASAVILGFIPGYAYLSLHINPRLIALIFLVASYLFILRDEKSKSSKYFAMIMFIFSALTHTLVAVVGLIFGFFMFRRELKKFFKVYPIAIIVAGFVWYLPLYLSHGITKFGFNFYEVFMELRSGVQYFIAESAVVADSVGLVALLLALFAIIRFRDRATVFLRDWFFLGIIAALIIGNRINEFMWFPIALLVAKLIPHWEEVTERLYLRQLINNPQLWLYLLFGYLAFLGTASILLSSSMPPSVETYDAMTWIKENTPEGSIVIAYWEDGHWITGIAERKNVIDAYAEYAPDIDERYKLMQVVFEGADLGKTLTQLRKYEVDYIYFPMFNTKYCTGFAYKTRYPYFELVHSEGMKFIYKIDYDGGAAPTDLCEQFIGTKHVEQ